MFYWIFSCFAGLEYKHLKSIIHYSIREDSAGKLALSYKRKCALGAVKLGSSLSCCNLVLLLASKLCLVGLVLLKIRKVRKKAAVILSIGAYE